MTRISNLDELGARITACAEALERKLSGARGRRHILVCSGTGCLSSSSQTIYETFVRRVEEAGLSDRVTVNQVGCFGLCSQGPFVKIYPEDTLYRLVAVEDVAEIMESDIGRGVAVERLLYVDPASGATVPRQNDITFYKKQVRIALHGCGEIDPKDMDEAIGAGAFQGLRRALEVGPKEVVRMITESGLRGRGGGGFPTGRKWQFAAETGGAEKFVVCNGDEGDPGAFMDRSILEGNPFAVIEGMMIAGFAIGASRGCFYIRAEYPVALQRVAGAIATLEEAGLLGDDILGTGFSFRLEIRPGAGAFVCGEETALLNSIMGRRGMPWPRPPFPAVRGLWGKPTVVNNVETLATVPYIMREGVEAFTRYGTEKSPGTKVFALGGKINNVGLVEIPMGATLRELIFEAGGGIPEGKKFKAIQTGGPSGGCLTEEFLDTPIDFDNMVAAGSMMGSGGAIVMDEDNCMVDVAKFYMSFICDESCGKCSPCRIGTSRMLEILERVTEGKGTMRDFEELEELGEIVRENSLCGLGQTAANPIRSTIRHFREEYIAHIMDKKCPARICKSLITYRIQSDKCKMCSLCSRKCPVEAITGMPGKTPFEIHQDMCVKCGMCLATCKFGAIYIR